MPRYVLLVDWTEQGLQAVDHTVDRLEEGRKITETIGCEIEHVWWTQGSHDMVSVVHAPDEEAMLPTPWRWRGWATSARRPCVRGARARCARSSAGSLGSRRRAGPQS
jgi:hypothetical protein